MKCEDAGNAWKKRESAGAGNEKYVTLFCVLGHGCSPFFPPVTDDILWFVLENTHDRSSPLCS